MPTNKKSSIEAVMWLGSTEFLDSITPTSSPRFLLKQLESAPAVIHLAQAMLSGQVTEQHIETAISQWLGEFRPGKHFANEASLAALAVALRGDFGLLATRYLADLASLEMAEVRLATLVARLCLDIREKIAVHKREWPPGGDVIQEQESRYTSSDQPEREDLPQRNGMVNCREEVRCA